MKYNINRDKETVEILDEDGTVLLTFTFGLLSSLRYQDSVKDVLMSIREMAVIRYTEKIDRGLGDLRLEVDSLLKEYDEA